MNLVELAALDAQNILEDNESGFSVDATLSFGTESTIVSGSFNSVTKETDPVSGLVLITQNPSFVVSRKTLEEKITAGDISNMPTKDWNVKLTYLGKAYNLFIVNPPRKDQRLAKITYILAEDN